MSVGVAGSHRGVETSFAGGRLGGSVRCSGSEALQSRSMRPWSEDQGSLHGPSRAPPSGSWASKIESTPPAAAAANEVTARNSTVVTEKSGVLRGLAFPPERVRS